MFFYMVCFKATALSPFPVCQAPRSHNTGALQQQCQIFAIRPKFVQRLLTLIQVTGVNWLLAERPCKALGEQHKPICFCLQGTQTRGCVTNVLQDLSANEEKAARESFARRCRLISFVRIYVWNFVCFSSLSLYLSLSLSVFCSLP